MGWIPKISVACISCMSCQQTRPISLSRQHRISTKLGMQHHIYLLSSLIISFYILTKFLLCYMFSKGHVMLTWRLFSDTSHWTSDFFLQKNPLNFHFNTRNHFRDEITGLVMNARLFTTLNNVDMFKIIEFYRFLHSAFCSWKWVEIFIMCSLEDDFVCVWFSKNGVYYLQSIAKCKYFLLFHHNNVMLKTDIMLDYW